MIIVSRQGGVNIEEVAAANPEAVSYIPIDVNKGLTSEQACDVADKLGLTGNCKEIASIVASNLYDLFMKKEALLLEINPFVEDICGKCKSAILYTGLERTITFSIILYFSFFFPNHMYLSDYALDCKCSFDDSSEFRQKNLFSFKDTTQMDPNEVEADKHNLNYITMDGNIGCMVNGAGLAMATMDIIQLYGGWPANFLDVGGTATVETVREGFKILSSDPNVSVGEINCE